MLVINLGFTVVSSLQCKLFFYKFKCVIFYREFGGRNGSSYDDAYIFLSVASRTAIDSSET